MNECEQPNMKIDDRPRQDAAAAIAHVKKDSTGSWQIHSLEEHLRGVADLASDFAAPFGNTDWAYLAGLWHDLGKYSHEFQSYIRTASGYDESAHLETRKGRVDHSTAGAIHSLEMLGGKGRALAYIIAGHHAGLGDWDNADTGRKQLSQRMLQSDLLMKAKGMAPDSVLTQDQPNSRPPRGASPALWIRMLFSCLVDADFLDTEAFMSPQRAKGRSRYPALADLFPLLESSIENLALSASPSSVNEIRKQVLAQCLDAAELSPGLFSLTVPTGGGKTLSSMAFALKHAIKFNKRRIVYVIPYTSIIEQTSEILREIFGDCVLEHHSNFDPDRETVTSRLACENWDAPVVVTTNVQFFESLFTARTSRARKLHRLADSVAILDEAQLIPCEFFHPIRLALEELSKAYGMSILFSTATQPALGYEYGSFKGLSNVREIVPDVDYLYRRLRRVQIIVPKDLNAPTDPSKLAQTLSKQSKVLCVVNRRDECRELARSMPEGTIHLSGYMCGSHRSNVIREIKKALSSDETVRVVSTQLVEAGVDLDFPVVFRAISGLDSIAQAAGRCNREGKERLGSVYLFTPWKPVPKGHLRHMEAAARETFRQGHNDLLSPQATKEYFQHLYWIKGKDLDKHGIERELNAGSDLSINFRSASEKFRLIDDSHQRSIFVLYEEGRELIELLRRRGPDRWLLRKLQRFSVTVPARIFQDLLNDGDINEVHEGYFAQATEGLYHPTLGFLGERLDLTDPDFLIV